MDEALEFCAARVREADKDRFLASLFAPERHRGPLLALYAFDAEISAVRDRTTQPLPGEVRLQWWRDVLTATNRGDASPVAAGLLETIRRYALPIPMLLDLIDAHTFDLYDEPMATVEALENYAGATSGLVIRLATHILNEGWDAGQEAACRHAGIACVMTAVLQRLALHARRGQRFLPDEILARHGVAAADIHAQTATAELRAALREMRHLAQQHLAALKSDSNAVPRQSLPAFLPVSLLPPLLAGTGEADPFHLPRLPQWRRQWILWRSARQPRRFIAVRPDVRR
jgi:phytoene synthase